MKQKSFEKVVIYGGGEVLGKLAMAILFPVSSFVMHKSEFAALSAIFPIIQVLIGVGTFGMTVSFLKLLTSGHQDKISVEFNTLTLHIVLSILFAVVIAAGYLFPNRSFYIANYELGDFILPASAIIILSSFITLNLERFQASRKATSFVFFSAGFRVVFAAVFVFYVSIASEISFITFLYLFLVVAVIFSFPLFMRYLKMIPSQIDRDLVSRIILMSFPVFLLSAFSVLSANIHRGVITSRLTIDDLADFGMIYTFTIPSTLIFAVYFRVTTPVLFKLLNENRVVQFRALLKSSLIVIFILVFVVQSLLYLVYSAGLERIWVIYTPRLQSYIWMSASVLVYCFYVALVESIKFYNLTTQLLKINIVMFPIYVGLSLAFSNWFGLPGVAIVFFLSQCVLSIVAILIAKYKLSVELHILYPNLLLLIFVLSAYLQMTLMEYGVLPSILFHLLIIFVISIIWYLKFRNELRTFIDEFA